MKISVQKPLLAFLGLLVYASPVRAIDIITSNPNQAANSASGIAGILSYGQAYDGISFGGVVSISSSIGGCSGSLLSDGYSILTAGHCVMSAGSTLATSVTVFFQGPTGMIADPISYFQVDPGYNGSNSTSGADLAVLTLSQAAPGFAVGYSLYTGSVPASTPLVVAGYGYGGTGATGANSGVYPYGKLRVGTNEYEDTGAVFGYSSKLLIGQFYDSAKPSTNALRVAHPYSASDEVDITPGDSGGPTFYDGQIAGVHDLGICYTVSSTDNNCAEPPSEGSANDSYFGEMFGDVSVAANLSFIEEAELPEPATAALFFCALVAAAGLRLRQRRV